MDDVKEALAEAAMHLDIFRHDHRMAVAESILRAQQKTLERLVAVVDKRLAQSQD